MCLSFWCGTHKSTCNICQKLHAKAPSPRLDWHNIDPTTYPNIGHEAPLRLRRHRWLSDNRSSIRAGPAWVRHGKRLTIGHGPLEHCLLIDSYVIVHGTTVRSIYYGGVSWPSLSLFRDRLSLRPLFVSRRCYRRERNEEVFGDKKRTHLGLAL